MRRLILLLGAFALLAWVGSAGAFAQAPNGWVQTQNWNLLFPLNQSGGATGGGAANMLGNWVAPHDIGSENPRALEVWNDIDFGGAALADGWAATALNADPIWVTLEAAEAALSLAAGTLPNGDVVDFQALVDSINTNWVQMQPGPPADIVSDNVLGLATTYVENTTGAPLVVDICSASDDSIQVWVNNVVATNHSEARGTAGDCAERNPAVLPPGISKLAVLVWEGTGGWGFRLALEVDGVKVTSADQDPPVVFLGPGTDQTGQEQYGIMRSRGPEDPLECAGAEDAEITLAGNAVGAPGDALTVVETISHAQGADITINAPGATVEDILPVDDRRPVGIFDDHRVIGNPDCTDVGAADPSGSDTTESGGVYTQSAAGNSDVWDGGDTFEYAYNRYEGDFDLSIKIVSLNHLESTNDWSKTGLMVRDQLISCSRHYFQCLPYPNSVRQVQARSVDGSCNDSFSNENYAQVGGVDVSGRAIYHRVTRRSGVIQGWVTDDAGVETDPTNDALWGGSEATETWAGEGPVYVGIATSEHNNDCGVMVVEAQVLNATGTQVSSFDPRATGKTLTYDTTRGDVDAGLVYTVSTGGALNISMSGEATSGGTPDSFIGGLGSTSIASTGNTGPVGAFDDSRDIGNPPIAGSISEDAGVYTITGSGNDIWDGGDDFYFAYQYVTGDFVAQMRILTRSESPERWGRHGIMARYDCTRGSKFSMAETQAPVTGVVNNFNGAEDWPRHHFRLFHRNNGNNRDYYQVNDEILGVPVFPTEGRLPTWMRLVRQGNVMYSYMSEDADGDGQPDNWCLVGSDSALGVPDELLVGVAIHGRANQATTITFDNWSVEPLEDPEDVILEKTDTQIQIDYTEPDGTLPGGALVSQRAGGFLPQIIGERLRLTQDGIGGSATAVLYPSPELLNAEDGFYVGFDAFMTKAPADPVTDSNPADGMTMAVIQGTLATVPGVCNIATEPRVTNLPTAVLVGTDSGGASTADADLGAGPYTNVSTTGQDLWAGGDSFMFQYGEVSGDFDIACEILSYTHSTGAGRWGKWGLMAREALDPCGRYTMAQGHGPTYGDVNDENPDNDTDDVFRQAVRPRYLADADNCNGNFENAVGPNTGDPATMNPRFMRLTRRGNVVKSWFSNRAGLADGSLDPCNDCNWEYQAPDDDWGDAAPATLFVGFANSEHNSDGAETQTLEFRLLTDCGGGVVPSNYAGDGGGALGYDAGLIRERTECRPSFAVEMDNWVGGGEPGNEPPDGGQQAGTPENPDGEWNWHTGLDVNASVSSIQTNVDFGVPTGDLPDIYAPEGVHFDVFYAGTGQIDVFLNDVQVLSRKIPPLQGPFLLGFTGGTGGATVTQEVDNLVLAKVAIVPPGGNQKPGDFNQDGGLDISDPVAELTHLFLGGPPPPCGDQTVSHPANITLLDANADGAIDISDAVGTLTFLFLGGPPLTSCTGGVPPCPCIVIPDCPDNPIGDCAP